MRKLVRSRNAIWSLLGSKWPPNLMKKRGKINGKKTCFSESFFHGSDLVLEVFFEDILRENDFLAWLLKGIARRQIRVNEPKAPVHILDGHIALVTPAIFNLFLDKNSLKKRLYEKRAGDKRVYTVLQRELEALDIHQRGTDGQNIVTVSVEGQRSKSELKVYLLNRACFPSLRAFAANPAIKIHL